MRTAAVTLIVLAFAAGTADLSAEARSAKVDAQGRGRNRANSQGIPPGHMPPPGECRVWRDGVPPGQQPRPTNCDQAERMASRDRNARVIYGDARNNRYENGRYENGRYEDGRYEDGRYENDPDQNGRYEERGSNGVTGRVIDILRGRDPNRYPTTGTQSGANRAAYDNGFRDGLEKGREDVRDNDSFDPVRHTRYRSADRGYNSSYGTKEQYKLVYRDGFEAGYAQGYGRRVR
jgi:hypothetical protein